MQLDNQYDGDNKVASNWLHSRGFWVPKIHREKHRADTIYGWTQEDEDN